MHIDKTLVFRNADADFSEYDNDDIEFRIFTIGKDDPEVYHVKDNLRECINTTLSEIKDSCDLNHIAVNINVYTKDGRYLADVKCDVYRFQSNFEEDSPEITREIYEAFSDTIPCMGTE